MSGVMPPRATDVMNGANTSDRPTADGRTTIGMRNRTIPPRTRKAASATGQEIGWASVARSDDMRIAPRLMAPG